MIEFDQLVDTVSDHWGVAGEALSQALMSLDREHLMMLTQHLDADQVIAMLDAANLDARGLPPDDLVTALEAMAEAVGEVVDDLENRKPAEAGEIR